MRRNEINGVNEVSRREYKEREKETKDPEAAVRGNE
jgi:hypothetical protein